MLIVVATSANILPGVLAGGLVNPDSYMRLVRLEDALQQHGAGFIVARDGSGAGTLLHWSHLIDMLLCLLAAPLRLVMDTHSALHAAAVAFGPLCMGALGLALVWAIAPVVEHRWLWLTSAAAALSGAIAFYGFPGEAHHHVLLLVVAAMTAGHALRGALGIGSAGAGIAMGAWAGVGIWLSPETMPFTLMAFGGLWLAWLLTASRDAASMMHGAAGGFAAVVIVAFAIDPPFAGYAAVEIDRISVVYVGLAVALAAMSSVIISIDRLTGASRLVAACATAAVCAGAWLAMFPAVLRGPDALMSASDTRAMFGAIVEMMPIDNVAQGIQLLLTGTLAALVLVGVGLAHRSLLVGYAAICFVVMLLLGALHVRFAAYAAVVSAAMLPVLLTRCGIWLARWPSGLQASAQFAVAGAFLLLPADFALPHFASAKAATGDTRPSCSLAAAASMMAGHAGQVVLSNPNDSPELLYRTRVLTVGSLYHRNVAAFMRARAAWRSAPSETIPDAVRATGASLVLVCQSPTRSFLVADLPPITIMDRLRHGQAPRWLHRISDDPGSGNVLYEVMP
jgi:hypothetical protein